MMATMADAHREWHLNSGVPVGLPGCPQDACHTEYLSYTEIRRLTRQRDINFAHMRGEEGDATIGCAHCGGIHFSVAYVRACAGQNVPTPPAAPAAPALDWTVPKPPQPEPAMPEISDAEAVTRMRARLDQQEAAEREAKRARYAAWRSIPVYAKGKGYYAVAMDGAVHFFRVTRPTKGKHAGKTFVEEQASDTFYKMGWVRTGEVLDAIAADPAAAAALYGQQIGRCARCNRTLTDETSRAIGIGPDCLKKG